jgi:hypothetical protein
MTRDPRDKRGEGEPRDPRDKRGPHDPRDARDPIRPDDPRDERDAFRAGDVLDGPEFRPPKPRRRRKASALLWPVLAVFVVGGAVGAYGEIQNNAASNERRAQIASESARADRAIGDALRTVAYQQCIRDQGLRRALIDVTRAGAEGLIATALAGARTAADRAERVARIREAAPGYIAGQVKRVQMVLPAISCPPPRAGLIP